MNADEVKVKVYHDVQAVSEHKDEIKKLIVPPSTEMFEGTDNQDTPLWIIGRKEEYCLTFDETSNEYGLAFRNILNSMVYLGAEGTVADAYNALISREEATDEPVRKSYKHRRT